MAVLCAGIGSRADQEVHHVVVAPANGVVKGSDALVVGLAGVTHLRETFGTYYTVLFNFSIALFFSVFLPDFRKKSSVKNPLKCFLISILPLPDGQLRLFTRLS